MALADRDALSRTTGDVEDVRPNLVADHQVVLDLARPLPPMGDEDTVGGGIHRNRHRRRAGDQPDEARTFGPLVPADQERHPVEDEPADRGRAVAREDVEPRVGEGGQVERKVPAHLRLGALVEGHRRLSPAGGRPCTPRRSPTPGGASRAVPGCT
jgi:hypothetical protein